MDPLSKSASVRRGRGQGRRKSIARGVALPLFPSDSSERKKNSATNSASLATTKQRLHIHPQLDAAGGRRWSLLPLFTLQPPPHNPPHRPAKAEKEDLYFLSAAVKRLMMFIRCQSQFELKLWFDLFFVFLLYQVHSAVTASQCLQLPPFRYCACFLVFSLTLLSFLRPLRTSQPLLHGSSPPSPSFLSLRVIETI